MALGLSVASSSLYVVSSPGTIVIPALTGSGTIQFYAASGSMITHYRDIYDEPTPNEDLTQDGCRKGRTQKNLWTGKPEFICEEYSP